MTILTSPAGAAPGGPFFAQTVTAMILHASRNSMANEKPETTATAIMGGDAWKQLHGDNAARADDSMRWRTAARHLILGFKEHYEEAKKALMP